MGHVWVERLRIMKSLYVDKERLPTGRRAVLERPYPALWTFSIQDQDICFWGTFKQAEHTARLYAEHLGMTSGTISVLDCRGEFMPQPTYWV